MNEERMGNEGAGERQYMGEIQEFMEAFPEAAQDPRAIPPEVWEEVRNGRSLVPAYARYLSEQSRREREDWSRERAAWRNRENAERSTGSMRAAERGLGDMDAFLRGFQG